ncbi:MAG: M16 family metallopeptidase [Allosphingosinicella sp.]|uniref:M16 family metallopeptidase n=1 Tax=Allosphingosinicella sp. TaxID=2823234 RepID=UPI0039284524
MPLIRTFCLAFLLIVSAPAAAQSAAQSAGTDWLYRGSDITPDPAWRLGTLANGMRYAVRQNPRPAGQVSIRLRVEVGALHEQEGEQGWAHLVEHLAFRGTASFADREARQFWQQLGASFGSDTNATTSYTQTVYQLDLPRNDRASLDRSLHVLSEMASSALFDPAAVEAERRIVLEEKGRMPELSVRMGDLSRGLFYAGTKVAERNIIGTEATLRAATAEGLRDFYRRWYRPERTTIVMIGDADPEMMAALIEARFGGWRGEGPAPADPDTGTPAAAEQRVAALVYPGAPVTAQAMWIRPGEDRPHTRERERIALEEGLAARIINRRLEAHARGDGAAFVTAAVGSSRWNRLVDTSSLAITARDGRWQEALSESFAILRDALQAPPSEAEIERELQNLRTGATAAVEGDPTVLSQQRAQQLINAIDAGGVVAAPAVVLANFEENALLMTPDRIAAAMEGLFAGMGPRLLLLTPEPVDGGTAAIDAALAAAERVAPAVRAADRRVSMDALPPLGPPGEEVSREHIEDMDVHIVRFANGSSLTFKQTAFEKGSVQVQLRFGEGMAALAPDQPSLAWLGGLVGPSGLADLDQDGVERLLTGRRMALAFGVGEDAFVLRGQTNGGDLADQLRLLATKLAHPRWDAALFGRFRANALQAYRLSYSSASARAGREFGSLARPGDRRWQPVERETIAETTVEQFRDFFTPLLAEGPVNAVIVGDVDLETAVEAMRRTIAALPARGDTAPDAPGLAVRPPAASPEPVRFTHEGDPEQAYALIGWSTMGGAERIRERRALGVAANILQVRLFDRLREAEGATYSPTASHSSSDTFDEWGIFYAAAEIRPENADTFFRIAREEVAKLAADAVARDEFERAQNPILSGLERSMSTNAYWMSALENWHRRPELIENRRRQLEDYRDLTPEEVRRAVARYVTEEGDWSMLVVPER